MAEANPVRFSSKYQDDEDDLLYYGYRSYNPTTGRWLGRDFAGERAQLNLHAFSRNDLLNSVDRLGLDVYMIRHRSWLPLIEHRAIVGDDGKGGSYIIDFMPRRLDVCNRVCGKGQLRYWHFPDTPVMKTINGQGNVYIAEQVHTTPIVDARLKEEAKDLNGQPEDPSFIVGVQDCNRFAWEWPEKARNLQDEENKILRWW